MLAVMTALECTRRWRARRGDGLICLGLELPRAELGSALVRVGLLRPLDILHDPDRPAGADERATLQRALQDFIDRELFGPRAALRP